MNRGTKLGIVGALMVALGVGGCSSSENEASGPGVVDEDPFGGEDEGEDAPAEGKTYWRVEVYGNSRSAVFGELDVVTVAATPVPAAAAEFMVVARDGDEVVDARPVHFPTEILEEFEDGDGVSSPIEDASEVVFIETSAVDRIELLAPGGEVLDAVEPEPLARDGVGLRDGEMPDAIGHVRVLGPGELEVLPPNLSNRLARVVEPNERFYDVIREGLERSTPAVASAVRTVAVVEYADPENAPLASTWGSSFVINKASLERENLVTTVVHEAAHNFHFLLDTADAPEPHDTWPADVLERALATAEEYRLGRGVPSVWKQMHESAQRFNLALPYLGNAWRGTSDADAIGGGFASAYGRRHWGEDIAEYIETVQMPEYGEGACPRLKARATVDEEIAISYVKLNLLQGIGGISRSRFDQCIGGLGIDDSPGIHLGDGVLSLRQGLDAGYTEYEGVPWFAFVGEDGDGYGVAVRVYAPNGDDALGIHRLDAITLFRDWTALPGVFVDHDDPIYARASGEGFVVITEASNERTRGAIIGLTLLNAFGQETDYLPYSPFNVPVR